jgi:hypothetical protein
MINKIFITAIKILVAVILLGICSRILISFPHWFKIIGLIGSVATIYLLIKSFKK